MIQQWEDPDAPSRVASTVGGASGDVVGSMETGENASHFHGAGAGSFIPDGQVSVTTGSFAGVDSGSGGITSSQGGNEARPVNVGVNYIIKT